MSVTHANKTESAKESQGVKTMGETAPQFADNRASTTAQLAMQQLMHNSPRSTAQRATANAMNASPVQQQKTIQRAEAEEELQLEAIPQTAQLADMAEEEPLQGKFETAQRAEDEELLQGKFETAQRVEDEEPLEGKFETAQRAEDEELLQGKFEPAQRAEKPNNTGLPNNLKSGIENLSGMSMDHVKVHYNSDKPAQLQAHAYAQGSEIHVAPGQEQHLPHEAWHVVQQAQGRVKPTMQMKGGLNVNDDEGLETEADVMGAKALQFNHANETKPISPKNNDNGIVQSKPFNNLSQLTIQLKPPTDQHVFRFTAEDGLVWSRDLETNKWCRPGDNGEKIFWTKADDNRSEALSEAGSVVGYFKNPKSIWGKKHEDLEAELIVEGFEKSDYKGTSKAHEYIKRLNNSSIISIVVNYGGGRHTHTLEQTMYEPAFYYKLEWNSLFGRIKVIDPVTYPAEEREKESYTFIEKD